MRVVEDILWIYKKVNKRVEKTEDDINQGEGEHHHEILSVHEADTIVDPGTMMVHIEDAPFALAAMVSPFGLEHVAGQAVPFPVLVVVLGLILAVPLHRHFARVHPDSHTGWTNCQHEYYVFEYHVHYVQCIH